MNDRPGSGFGTLAYFIELLITVVFQFVVFGIVPAGIRQMVQARRR